ncbi:MAG: ester cyclase [Parvibaculaceae bacterium]
MNINAYAKAAQTAFNARDVEALGALWADDLEYQGPDGEIVKGKEHSIAREVAIWEGVPDIQVKLESFAADKDKLTVQGRMTGTHSGTLSTADGTFPPTDRTVVIEFVALFTFKDDLASRERVYYDRASLAMQLTAV